MCARASLQVWGLLMLLGADAQFHLDPPKPEGAECWKIGDEVWSCQKDSQCPVLSQLASSGRRITCSTDSDGVHVVCCPSDSNLNRFHDSISAIKCAEYQTMRCGGGSSRNSETDLGSSAVAVGSSGPVPADLPFQGLVPDEENSSSGDAPDVGILGGVPAAIKDFPHSALIGYGDEDLIKWRCGGTLISERFVLSAAHCNITSLSTGPPRWVLLGDEDYKNDTDDAQPQMFTITETFIHPDYINGQFSNDIVLFKLDRDAEFTDYVAPACLHPRDPSGLLTATGWGLMQPQFAPSQIRKVNISVVFTEECTNKVSVDGFLKNNFPTGINGRITLCAGGYGKDTCEGDSGGPLILADPGDSCLAQLVGVTSAGPSGCTYNPNPGVYVRVAHFIPWIESIVWPNHDKSNTGSSHTA